MYNQGKARAIWTFTLFHPFKKAEGAVLLNVFQNGFYSFREARGRTVFGRGRTLPNRSLVGQKCDEDVA